MLTNVILHFPCSRHYMEKVLLAAAFPGYILKVVVSDKATPLMTAIWQIWYPDVMLNDERTTVER